ncbi:hypothetical protein BJX63DRAFT_260410 [Aspergillus granulosus]|uniref:Uncharacterized protein n=1 Tax=Aspergillus granulosus TaxID=176169 RepID=A0ABR4H9P4_9EURO
MAVSSKLLFKAEAKVLTEFSLLATKQQEASHALHPVVQDWCYHITALNGDRYFTLTRAS